MTVLYPILRILELGNSLLGILTNIVPNNETNAEQK